MVSTLKGKDHIWQPFSVILFISQNFEIFIVTKRKSKLVSTFHNTKKRKEKN